MNNEELILLDEDIETLYILIREGKIGLCTEPSSYSHLLHNGYAAFISQLEKWMMEIALKYLYGELTEKDKIQFGFYTAIGLTVHEDAMDGFRANLRQEAKNRNIICQDDERYIFDIPEMQSILDALGWGSLDDIWVRQDGPDVYVNE